jgi:ligand-binding sensor domain-containing protein
MWLSVVRKGVFRYLDGKWSEYGDVSALPRGPAIVEVADDGGSLWFGYPNSRIAQLSGGRVQVFDATRGLEVGNVLSILAVGDDIWAGGELGLVHLGQGRFVQIHNASGNSIQSNLWHRQGAQWRPLAEWYRWYCPHPTGGDRARRARSHISRSLRYF